MSAAKVIATIQSVATPEFMRFTFDATEWFEQASQDELKDLFSSVQYRELENKKIAEFFESRKPEIKIMLRYCRSRPESSFKCTVEESEVVKWLIEKKVMVRNG